MFNSCRKNRYFEDSIIARIQILWYAFILYFIKNSSHETKNVYYSYLYYVM
jgi:hypothetical protein